MSDSDEKIQAGTFDNQKWQEFNEWLDGYLAAIAVLVDVAGTAAEHIKDRTDEHGILLNADDGILPGEGDAITAALAALDAFNSRPETGFTPWGFSHRKRKTKRVESRQ